MNKDKICGESSALAQAVKACELASHQPHEEKLILQTACGMDVHKSFIVAVIKTTDFQGKVITHKTRIIHGFFHKTIFRVLSSKCKQIYCD